MLIYLAHAKANYASPNDGYVNGMRDVGYPFTLYSFGFLEGQQELPIHDQDLRSTRLGGYALGSTGNSRTDRGDAGELR